MKKKKKNIYNYKILIIGLIIAIIPLCFNKLSAFRLLLNLIGIIVITVFFKKKDFRTNAIIFIILFAVSIFIDSIVSTTFARIPIYTYNIVTTKNTRVFNSIGYRVWQCDINSTKNMKVDQFYSKGYMCDPDNIEQIDSNSFLNSVIENYDEYHNTFVKIRGKISKKNSQNSVEMQPYEETEITINGYVNFADNITLKIMFNENINELDLYDIYDEITVIGVVKTLEHKDEKFVIYLSEAKMVQENNFDKYEIIINEEKDCSSDKSIVYSGESKDIYTYCIDNLTIKYGNNNYEISSALSSSKITIDSLFANEISNEESQEGNILHEFKNYKILECNKENSNDIIIGPSSMKLDSTTCNINENSPIE